MIDTSVLVSIERKRISAADFINSLDDEATIASITASELLMGLHRAATEEQRVRRQEFIDRVLSNAGTLAFDLEVAPVHAQLWANLTFRGQIVGLHDLIIAATALHYRLTVLTANVREFERVQGLSVQNPNV